MKKNAFTMIEMVFVIIILGILAAVAIPRFANSTRLATIAKGQADIATIRSAIVNERQTQLIQGNTAFIGTLSNGTGNLFTGDGAGRNLLTYGIARNNEWAAVVPAFTTAGATESYDITVDGIFSTFDYYVADGRFDCNDTVLGGVRTAAQTNLCTDLRD